jgi:NADH-quinone oxidoreductase subunit A
MTRGYGSVLAAAPTAVWPVAVYTIAVLALTGIILLLAHVLGERHGDLGTGDRYESGIEPASPLPRRLSIEFYQLAIFFVVFDIETVFIVAWAVAARRLGWTGYFEVLVFAALLLAGLVYLWKEGALDWGPSGRARRARGQADDGRQP